MKLNRDEEGAFVQEAQAGNETALQRLIDAHQPAICNLARRHLCHGLTLDDQTQNGIIGFIIGVRRFDLARGYRLWSYAKPWVRERQIDAMAKQLGLKDAARKHFRAITDAYTQLRQQHEWEPSAEQVAIDSHVPITLVKQVLEAWRRRETSLEAELDDTGEDHPQHQTSDAIRQFVPGPEEVVLHNEAMAEAEATIFRCLGQVDGSRFLVLFVLGEAVGYEYSWDTICGYLTDGTAHPAPPWEETVADAFPQLSGLPCTWADVLALFRTPPMRLTNSNLRKYYSRAQMALQRRK